MMDKAEHDTTTSGSRPHVLAEEWDWGQPGSAADRELLGPVVKYKRHKWASWDGSRCDRCGMRREHIGDRGCCPLYLYRLPGAPTYQRLPGECFP